MNDFAQGMQALADATKDKRPSVGKYVTVDSGKHSGKTGIVFWHGVDKFASTRYATDGQLMLREIIGRNGYRVGIKTNDGERIFVSADNVTVKKAE